MTLKCKPTFGDILKQVQQNILIKMSWLRTKGCGEENEFAHPPWATLTKKEKIEYKITRMFDMMLTWVEGQNDKLET